MTTMRLAPDLFRVVTGGLSGRMDLKWLVDRLPPDPSRPTLLHGDFKLDNVMLDALDVGRLVAVFDWEMSAVGDPLVDLGILLAYWIHAVPASQQDALTSITRRAGWFTREELLERYAARTGNDLTKIEFYEVFAVFKLAVVLQQIFYRYHRGQTDDARFARLDERVTWLQRIATALAGGSCVGTGVIVGSVLTGGRMTAVDVGRGFATCVAGGDDAVGEGVADRGVL